MEKLALRISEKRRPYFSDIKILKPPSLMYLKNTFFDSRFTFNLIRASLNRMFLICFLDFCTDINDHVQYSAKSQ